VHARMAASLLAQALGRRHYESVAARRLARATESSSPPPAYGDEQVANREIGVWHGATDNGP
jgi:hypothetical protein